MAEWLAEKAMALYPEAEVVAGVATGAIAHGVLAADRMKKPCVYVRPKPKDHGTWLRRMQRTAAHEDSGADHSH